MNWKRTALIAAWGVAVVAWLALVGVYFTDPTLAEWTAAVTIAALVTEIAFWLTAGILGVTVIESRKAIWKFLTRPFRRRA